MFSFDTDTGLKQALATVNDYNPLMKVRLNILFKKFNFLILKFFFQDFPINELLSATELDRIRTAVQVELARELVFL